MSEVNVNNEKEIDCEYTQDLICPYCGEAQLDGWDNDDGDCQKETCGNCEKEFVYSTNISRSFTSLKADCLNGAEHPWKEWLIYNHFVNPIIEYRRCSVCNKKEYRHAKE